MSRKCGILDISQHCRRHSFTFTFYVPLLPKFALSDLLGGSSTSFAVKRKVSANLFHYHLHNTWCIRTTTYMILCPVSHIHILVTWKGGGGGLFYGSQCLDYTA
jgi:hypothetical protein